MKNKTYIIILSICICILIGIVVYFKLNATPDTVRWDSIYEFAQVINIGLKYSAVPLTI